MMRIDRLCACLILYSLASMADALITIHLVRQCGCAELNPHMAPYVGTPMQFALEFCSLGVVLLSAYIVERVSGMGYVVPLGSGTVRLLAVIHNLLLACFGWVSPIADLYRMLYL